MNFYIVCLPRVTPTGLTQLVTLKNPEKMETSHTNDLAIEAGDVKKAALLLRAINNSLRQEILEFIHLNSSVTVTQVHNKFNVEQSVASDHLGILKEAKLVVNERQGRFIFYSVNYKELNRIHSLITEILEG